MTRRRPLASSPVSDLASNSFPSSFTVRFRVVSCCVFSFRCFSFNAKPLTRLSFKILFAQMRNWVPPFELTRYPTDNIRARLYCSHSRVTCLLPSCWTVRNFRTVDLCFNSPDLYIYSICSLIFPLLDLKRSTICAWVSQTVSWSTVTSRDVWPSRVWNITIFSFFMIHCKVPKYSPII